MVETVDFIPYLGFSGIAVHRDFADRNPDAIKRLVKGAIRLQRWIDDNAAQARQTSNKALEIPDNISGVCPSPLLRSQRPAGHSERLACLLHDGNAKVIDPIENFRALVDS